MAAKSSGGTAARRRAQDQARAAHLKAIGDRRTTCRCPSCHRLVDLGRLPDHLRGGCGK